MRIISFIYLASVVLADLVAFNRYRNSAGAHVMKRTENKPSISVIDKQLLSVMMQLLKNGANPAALKQINLIIKKTDQKKSKNSRLSRFLRSSITVTK